jgi:hypothetical protein
MQRKQRDASLVAPKHTDATLAPVELHELTDDFLDSIHQESYEEVDLGMQRRGYSEEFNEEADGAHSRIAACMN